MGEYRSAYEEAYIRACKRATAEDCKRCLVRGSCKPYNKRKYNVGR